MAEASNSISTAASPHRLERGVLNIPNAIALSAAAMAPVLAVVLNAPAAGPQAGGALPLSFLVAFIACLLVGNSVVQFARRLPSAGSFYTFNSAGLGSSAGFYTGWLFWIGYAILAPGLFTAFGSFVHDYFVATFNSNVPWWLFSLLAMLIILGLSLRSIRASVNVDLVLLFLEVVIFLVLSVLAIVHGGSGNTIKSFLPSSSPHGVSGVGLGVVFGILSFIGFDAAATLGEETKNPKRNVPMAVSGALISVGVFYVFAMYALTTGYGLNNHANLLKFLSDPNPFVTLGHHYASWLLQPIELAAIAGLFSCFMAIHNTTVRVMFSMGRDRVLPVSFGHVHAKWFSPYIAIIGQTIFTVAIGLAGGAWLGPGATGNYGFTGSIGTVAIVIVYCMSNIALIRYFWKLPERSVWRHIIIPIAGVAAFAYPLWSVAKPGQSWPYSLVPWITLAWIALGTVLLLTYRKTSPEKIAAIGTFVAEEDLALGEEDQSLLAARATSLQHPTVEEEAERHPEIMGD